MGYSAEVAEVAEVMVVEAAGGLGLDYVVVPEGVVADAPVAAAEGEAEVVVGS